MANNLTIYDNTGKKIIVLLNKTLTEGNHIVDWDATNLAGSKVTEGVYFYQLISNKGYKQTGKVIYSK